MYPQNKTRERVATLATRPRVGPRTLVNPQPTRVGKIGGSRGASPPWRGLWGCPPTKSKEGASCHISNPPASGAQNAGEPSAYEGGPRGGPGGKAPWRGVVGGVPPQNQKRGRVAHISKPTNEWDPKRQQTLSQRGWAKRGSRGRSPLAGGLGDVPPEPE
jgi:hypothetical protein